MALKPDSSDKGVPFGVRPFIPVAVADFAAADRFARQLQQRYVLAEPQTPPIDTVLAGPDRSSVSINPAINVGITVALEGQAPERNAQEPVRLELHREHYHSRTEHIVSRASEAAARNACERFYSKLTERFTRVETVKRQPVTAGGQIVPSVVTDRTGNPSAMPKQEPLVLHRQRQEPVAVATPAVRQLPTSIRPSSTSQRITPKEIGFLADEVISQLNRQSVAWRERFGRS